MANVDFLNSTHKKNWMSFIERTNTANRNIKKITYKNKPLEMRVTLIVEVICFVWHSVQTVSNSNALIVWMACMFITVVKYSRFSASTNRLIVTENKQRSMSNGDICRAYMMVINTMTTQIMHFNSMDDDSNQISLEIGYISSSWLVRNDGRWIRLGD